MHQLTVPVIRQMVEVGTISPCHQELKKYSGSTTKGVELYAEFAPVFKVCRGFAEARRSLTHPHAVWYHIEDQLTLRPLKQDVDLISVEEIL